MGPWEAQTAASVLNEFEFVCVLVGTGFVGRTCREQAY